MKHGNYFENVDAEQLHVKSVFCRSFQNKQKKRYPASEVGTFPNLL